MRWCNGLANRHRRIRRASPNLPTRGRNITDHVGLAKRSSNYLLNGGGPTTVVDFRRLRRYHV